MPRTVDHIVATHRLAAERRKAGKPIWDETIDLTHVWDDDDLSFEEKRDAIVARLKTSRWFKNDPQPQAIVDVLAQTENVDEFDGWFDELYDHADYARIWIKTF